MGEKMTGNKWHVYNTVKHNLVGTFILFDIFVEDLETYIISSGGVLLRQVGHVPQCPTQR